MHFEKFENFKSSLQFLVLGLFFDWPQTVRSAWDPEMVFGKDCAWSYTEAIACPWRKSIPGWISVNTPLTLEPVLPVFYGADWARLFKWSLFKTLSFYDSGLLQNQLEEFQSKPIYWYSGLIRSEQFLFFIWISIIPIQWSLILWPFLSMILVFYRIS